MKTQKPKLKTSDLKREFSAGGVVYKRIVSSAKPFDNTQGKRSELLWLIGKHSGYNKWVLPKGLIEKGERGFETAVRETEEEMGVKASLVSENPIHKVQYFYWADFKKAKDGYDYEQSDDTQSRRRVVKYQESGGRKIKVFKVVSFYLLKYKNGNPGDHDWEMSEAGWFAYEQALRKLAFAGEKEALEKARDKMRELLTIS